DAFVGETRRLQCRVHLQVVRESGTLGSVAAQSTVPRKPWYRVLYIQVLIAVFIGILVGNQFPDLGKSLKPLGDGFVNLVKMIIAPVIFCTVVHGIASMTDLKKLGRVGLKALVYFEVVSTLALVIGLIVVNTLQPGAGFNVDPKTLDVADV